MSEAEQSRGPQRDEVVKAGSAGKGEDSVSGEGTSGDANVENKDPRAEGGAPGEGDAGSARADDDGGDDVRPASSAAAKDEPVSEGGDADEPAARGERPAADGGTVVLGAVAAEALASSGGGAKSRPADRAKKPDEAPAPGSADAGRSGGEPEAPAGSGAGGEAASANGDPVSGGGAGPASGAVALSGKAASAGRDSGPGGAVGGAPSGDAAPEGLAGREPEAPAGAGSGTASGAVAPSGRAASADRAAGTGPAPSGKAADRAAGGASRKPAQDASAVDALRKPAAQNAAAAAPVKKETPGSGGRLLARRYRLDGVLGRGGMGTVWRAVDETLGRTVAVKELRFPNAIDEDEKRRLITRTLREAKAIARIRNNSAVTVYDVVDEDDRPWIVMELVEGKSLAEVVREDGVLAPRRAAEVGLAILDVLRSAHREGILHRDVKPSNVLIGKDGRVVLTDFGIAQVEGDPSITSTGMLVGAPSYISPERARGHKPGPAADLWSLGGLLYASVEGSPPYDKGSAIATLTAVMTEPLDPPKNAGPLADVIYGLLAKDPAQRLDDAGARALLTRVVNTPEPPAAPPAPSPEETRVIPIPPPPPPTAPETRPAPVPKDQAAADRVRGALRSVRNAAAAAKADARLPGRSASASAATTASAAGPASAATGSTPGRRPAPVRAPITDVVPKRTLVIIAVVAALAVLSTVLVLTLGGGDEDNGAKGADGSTRNDKTASAGAESGGGDGKATGGSAPDGGASPDSGENPDAGTGEDGGGSAGSGGEPGEDGGTGEDTGSGDGGGTDALPDGYVMVSNDQFRFSMAMPEDFRFTGIAGRNSGAKFGRDGGPPKIQVDFNNSPKDDAASAWAAAVAGVSASSNGYKHIGIRKVEFNGYPTVADWEFERRENGQRVRILNRGFKVDARRGYAIMITCKADAWDGEECSTLRKTAFATFRPKD
ncbi:protein kinase [Streptomyces sp. NPDC005805]|uniref:serine/threonine protein kinase n=1 Tax=Streptomyces sp. NPDC005805 TaxID=3157068 RepID=UPI0033EAA177